MFSCVVMSSLAVFCLCLLCLGGERDRSLVELVPSARVAAIVARVLLCKSTRISLEGKLSLDVTVSECYLALCYGAEYVTCFVTQHNAGFGIDGSD